MRVTEKADVAVPTTPPPLLGRLVACSIAVLWNVAGATGCSAPTSADEAITDAPVTVTTGDGAIATPHGVAAARSGLVVIELRSDEPSCTGLPTPEAGQVAVTFSIPADRVVVGRYEIVSDPLREDDIGLSVTMYHDARGEADSTTYIVTSGVLELDGVDAGEIRGGVRARDIVNDVAIDGRFSATRCAE